MSKEEKRKVEGNIFSPPVPVFGKGMVVREEIEGVRRLHEKGELQNIHSKKKIL